jgi:hypothetical protein
MRTVADMTLEAIGTVDIPTFVETMEEMLENTVKVYLPEFREHAQGEIVRGLVSGIDEMSNGIADSKRRQVARIIEYSRAKGLIH